MAARIRKNREIRETVDDRTYILRRPTHVEMAAIVREGKTTDADIAIEFCIGWEGVTEHDLVGGGGTDLVPFDELVWREYISDRPQLWPTLANRVIEAWTAHKDALAASTKN